MTTQIASANPSAIHSPMSCGFVNGFAAPFLGYTNPSPLLAIALRFRRFLVRRGSWLFLFAEAGEQCPVARLLAQRGKVRIAL